MIFKKKEEEKRFGPHKIEQVEVDENRVVLITEVGNITVDEKNVIFAGRNKKGLIKNEIVDFETHCNEKGFLFKVKGDKPFEIQVNMQGKEPYFEVAPRTESWSFHPLGGEKDDMLTLKSVKEVWRTFKSGELINLMNWGTERLVVIGQIVHYKEELEKAAELYEHLKSMPKHPKVKDAFKLKDFQKHLE